MLRFALRALTAVLILLVALGASAWVWRSQYLPPRMERLYQQASQQYRLGQYRQVIRTLEPRHPWLTIPSARVESLLGWSYWRLQDPGSAQKHFAQAYRLDASLEDARLGLAYSAFALGDAKTALPLMQELAAHHPDDEELRKTLGQAYVATGLNFQAAQLYKDWLKRYPDDKGSQLELVRLYGYPEDQAEFPLALPNPPRPDEPQVLFRTQGDYFQVLNGGQWQTVYLVGANVGPARPNEFPSTASRDFATYSEWLQQIAAMNANTIRVYTILPPAFYQAFRQYNLVAKKPLWMIHEVWLEEKATNLYDPATEQEFRNELLTTIDLLHGNANVPLRPGHNYGIYTADVSRWVIGLAVGREVEPNLVVNTNRKNAAQTSYHGRYISLEEGEPSEVWFAGMCDTAATYEMERYNAQRPLTIVNWPPLDPASHPTEGTYLGEVRYRKAAGEDLNETIDPNFVYNDMDVVSIDITHFKTAADFSPGLFALYHVYQHWPDFLLHEPKYAEARDAQGPNRYLGYLEELKSYHRGFPLLIGEYGISSSLGVSHVHPQGWNNGGQTEKQQAELLARFSRNIHDTGCAGGIVFEWVDEWFKHVDDLDTPEFERPWDSNPLWFNPLDPEKSFGLVGFRPSRPVPLLRGNPDDWSRAQKLAEAPHAPDRAPSTEIHALYADSDFAYLYIRLDVEPAALGWEHWNYRIALNTLPGKAGSQMLPEIPATLDSGANFLIDLAGPDRSRLLIAEDYNPNQIMVIPGRAKHTRLSRKRDMKIELRDESRFVERMTEVNIARYGKDGQLFPAIDYNRSRLPYGTADPGSKLYDDHALWHVDAQKGMIEVRIPWSALLVMDPPHKMVFDGTGDLANTVRSFWGQGTTPLSTSTTGITISAFSLFVPGPLQPKSVTSSLPVIVNDKLAAPPPLYSWEPWRRVEYTSYFKPAYFALQKLFGEWGAMGRRPGRFVESARSIGK